ncbi:PBP1A family penicillin-binding protein [Candidatus Gottesmanbacteria bacterium]|nr:PBP1A family penicillin-binding protein [Candidatus Gottesmanbacteria bacterium]
MDQKPILSREDKILDLILTILLIPPFILKKIGDWVLYAFRNLFPLLGNLITKTKYKISTYKISNKALKVENVIFKKKNQLTFPKFQFPQLPSLHLPRPRLPKVNIPHLRINFPPRPHIILPPFFTKIQYFTLGILATIIFLFIPYNLYTFLSHLPTPDNLSLREIPVTTKIYDRSGKLLYEIYADQNRTPLDLKEIPNMVKRATIAIEDQDFYYHGGISLKAITRAFLVNVNNNTTSGPLQGGSTITQQLIKSALLTPERTIERKIKEIILAFWAERLYTKDEILEMYLNQVPYGGTAWGIEAAAETYFGKNVKDLTLSEASLLAGLPAAPTLYSPFGAHPEFAKRRQKEVLTRMVEDGYITKKEADNAYKDDLNYILSTIPIKAPHFVMHIKGLLEQKYGPRMVEKGGLRVITSLDLDIQNEVQKIVKNNIDNLKSLSVGNGAALVTNPKTGEILAMVGSKDYFDNENDGNVNVALSLRQPGSSIKVVNYSLALQKGYTAASILEDTPITYHLAGSPSYTPVNYDNRFHGKIPLRSALANSYNIPAVKVLASLGVTNMIAQGKKMGITTWNDEERYGLSLTLGGGEVTMLDMAKVYGTLANQGKRVDLLPILKVTDYKGSVYEDQKVGAVTEAIPPNVAYILSDILADNNARSPAFGSNSSLHIPGKTVSVKTGTSNDKRDNWTLGYTPSFVVAVWVGNNDNSPMNPILTSGITGASPIWHDIMANLLKGGNEQFPKPDDVLALPCYGRTEYFIKGTEPPGGCGRLPTPIPTPG